MRWHRYLGVSVLVLILAHVTLIVSGYARQAETPVGTQAWSMFTTMSGTFAAAGILVGIALLAIRWIRRRLPYELWHLLHLATYLILFLAYAHQLALGTDLQSPAAHGFWLGLYALAVACVVWGRLIAPARLNLRHRLRVAAVVPESADTVSIYLEGRYLSRLPAQPGQFLRWRFLTAGRWWQSHPFSLSKAPNRHWLRLTVHAAGTHTRKLRKLRPGTRVTVQGPFGGFTAERRTRERALFIAGGSGIAPIRALLDQIPRGSVRVITNATRPATPGQPRPNQTRTTSPAAASSRG